jgi:hypothetical protein
MKLTDLYPQSQKLPIAFPNGADTGIVLDVVGQDSPQYRAVMLRQSKAFLGSTSTPEPEALAQMNAERVASHIVGWVNLQDEQGAPLPYSHEKAVDLMAKPELRFVAEQVEAFAEKRTNFFSGGNATTL